jgi:hypothetical protein
MNIIFDYDDTLFPTTFFKEFIGETSIIENPGFLKAIEKIEDMSLFLVRKAKTLGTVAIITNAEARWVPFSLSRHMKRLYEELRDISVYSCRDAYMYMLPVEHWKERMFRRYARNIPDKSCVISIGDSSFEILAAKNLNSGEDTSKSFVIKTVKLQDRPTLKTLYLQLQSLEKRLDMLCEIEGHIDMQHENGEMFMV